MADSTVSTEGLPDQMYVRAFVENAIANLAVSAKESPRSLATRMPATSASPAPTGLLTSTVGGAAQTDSSASTKMSPFSAQGNDDAADAAALDEIASLVENCTRSIQPGFDEFLKLLCIRVDEPGAGADRLTKALAARIQHHFSSGQRLHHLAIDSRRDPGGDAASEDKPFALCCQFLQDVE